MPRGYAAAFRRRRSGGGGAPGCVVTSAASEPIITTFDVTFTFTEDVTGFVVGDITVGNGSAGSFVAVSDSVYTATITPTAPGTVTVSVAAGVCVDAAGIANLASNTLSIQAFTFDVVTTAPGQTLTIQGLTVSASTTVYWGDGNSDIYTGSGVRTHVYASAGTWHVTIAQPTAVTSFDMRDSKAIIYTSRMRDMPLTNFYLTLAKAVLNTADMGGWNPTNWTCLTLPAGSTITINSAHMATWNPTNWRCTFLPAGSTITINSAHMVTWNPTLILCSILPPGSVVTIAASDLWGWTKTTTFDFHSSGLTQAQVDACVAGLYVAAQSRTVTGGTIDLSVNASPSGIYGPACPPATGQEYRYELLNDTCGVIAAGETWSTITVS